MHQPVLVRPFVPHLLWPLAALLSLGLLTACQSEPEPPADEEMADPTHHNVELNLVIVGAPEGFAVSRNEGATFELTPDGEGDGRMWIEVGEVSDFGIDLVKIVNSQKEGFLAKPGGEYSGGSELRTEQLGKAYYTRGRFDEGGTTVEELRVFAEHPIENRLVTLYYAYPYTGDENSGERVQQILELLARIQVEAAVEPAEEPPVEAEEGANNG